ncbi:MBL fold metallo-hydrolase [Patescibacteria group bacterium]|nr:MBL fold metallo-hydrolase [Patescibacteria group bacterium]MCL5091934.1 MBL fold metallo-hydrolase [Patescibacteria group bacterium]
MEIKYLGHSAFSLKTKDARLVTDPFSPKMVGLKFPKIEADIVTVSHQHEDHNQTQLIAGAPLVIDWPGQFEKNGVRISGYRSFHDDKQGGERGEVILYKIEADGIAFLHCSDLGMIPDDAFIDQIGDVDVLAVPVGGYYTINADQSALLIKKIEPAIVIPMHYRVNQTQLSQLDPVEVFLKKMGVETTVPTPKLVLKKEDLLDQEMRVVVMEITS